jgi:hypothetical protein
MRRLLLATALALAAMSPAHALDVGDSVKFPTDLTSFGCSLIEDARQATSHVARYGSSKESSYRFIKPIYDASLRRPPDAPIPRRLCDFFFEGVLAEYRVLKTSDDGYVCLTSLGWEGRCMWVNLTIWNVQITSKNK